MSEQKTEQKTTLPDHCIGSKFRPVHWHDIESGSAVLVGWGISEKAVGKRFYEPRAYRGEYHPFKTKAEAQAVCNELNAQSAARTQEAA